MLTMNEYALNQLHSQKLQHEAEKDRLAKTASTSGRIAKSRNQIGAVITRLGSELRQRYAEPQVTTATLPQVNVG